VQFLRERNQHLLSWNDWCGVPEMLQQHSFVASLGTCKVPINQDKRATDKTQTGVRKTDWTLQGQEESG